MYILKTRENTVFSTAFNGVFGKKLGEHKLQKADGADAHLGRHFPFEGKPY